MPAIDTTEKRFESDIETFFLLAAVGYEYVTGKREVPGEQESN